MGRRTVCITGQVLSVSAYSVLTLKDHTVALLGALAMLLP